MTTYVFDGRFVGLLSCIFRAFQFRQFDVELTTDRAVQVLLFDDLIEVASDEQHAQRVWRGLQQKLSASTLQQFYYAYLSEQLVAWQHLFNFAVYAFQSADNIERDYGHADVLAVSQWAKQVGREKHRMEAFVRFKKCQDGLFLSLIQPDFDVLPIIERHFKSRYQDQRWLIYDEKRHYGIYYDLEQLHQVDLNAQQLDRQIATGHSQQLTIELAADELLYDQLWKDYFQSVNIVARQNIRLHIQYVPRRYWRYLNEKQQ